MTKSQLRRLAAAHAAGEIDPDVYRERRRALIDAIAAGEIPIERDGAAPEPTRGVPARIRRRGALLAAALAGLAALLWLLRPAPTPAPAPPPPPAVATPAVPVARTLVESFLARRDFGEAALERFAGHWDALGEAEQRAARGTPWFRNLVRALGDEVAKRNALIGQPGGAGAADQAHRIRALGTHLDVANELPPVSRPPGAATAGAAAPSTQDPPSAREWLAAQSGDDLTLQLFAVNRLERVQGLVAAHPELVLRILESAGAPPRFRVLHGVYPDTEAARAGFEGLPAELSGAAGEAIVKSFAAVREDLAAVSPGLDDPPPAPDAAHGGEYTLQLFASAQRASAEALIDAFPALPLQARRIAGDAVPFRVVLGRYASAEQARGAAATLPRELLERIGSPLVKSVRDTGEALR